jgi:hypothetical protein
MSHDVIANRVLARDIQLMTRQVTMDLAAGMEL